MINMDINSSSSVCELSVLLERPFLKTTRAMIDVDKGSLALRHGEKCEKILVSNNTTTIYPAFSTFVLFQGDGKPSKLGVLDGSSAVSNEYG